MRIRHLIAAALVSLTATIGMAAEPAQRFEHEGRTYEFQTEKVDGGTVISGRQLDNRHPFRLVVRNGRVTGRSGNTPVSFRVRDAAGASGGVAATGN